MSEFKFSLLGTMLMTVDLWGNLCPAGFNRFLHSSWCCFGRGSSVLHFTTRTPGLSVFWFHSLWQQLCNSVETCSSAMLLSPNSSPRLLFCTRPQSPHDLPLALTFQVLLKGFVLSLLISGHTAILSCRLVQTSWILNPSIVLPQDPSTALSRSFSRGNLIQPNSALTSLKSSLKTGYKHSTLILICVRPLSSPIFPNFSLFHTPLSF